MRIDVYLLLHPADVDADNARNFHIIRAQYDDEYKKYYFPYRWNTLCNGYELKRSATIYSSQGMKFDDDFMRRELAMLQNSGKQLCANCVKRFYADDDE